ncbi:hypothetical protein C4D60_Mb04t14120 [Musa balbisiana]|uniref:Uncharacterized protein n=1 Tax=Musa balbisiana TaxID=52838 RepID=A0A4S8KBX1_MUSBA|nr:hypothetical protein C4D60_Mb04t14120 [Musa balbisiana]
MEGLRNVLFEKMKEAEGALTGIEVPKLASSLGDKLEQTKGVMESMKGALWEKLPQLLQFSSRKAKEAEGAVKSSVELISEPLKEKLPLLSQAWDDVVGFLVGKLEGVLPAAASPEASRILVQLVLATILLYPSLVFISYCLKGAFNTIGFVGSIVIKDVTYCLKGVFKIVTYTAALSRRRCCCFFRGAGKTMKAPGRKGLRIPRATFEFDPKRYFLDLRATAPMEAPRRPSKKLCLGLVLFVAVVVVSVSALK